MRYIYRLRYYCNCCFIDVQFDNIEYFAKPQITPTECTHTLACVVMKELNSARVQLECYFTAWFSRLKCIKNDSKIQDMGAENVYIYISYS